MPAKVKSVLSTLSDALETAAGWALLAVAVYAAVFVDFTGGGSLWTSLRGLTGHAVAVEDPGPGAIQAVKIPLREIEKADPNQERFLVIDEPKADKEGMVTVAVAAPDAYAKRPEAAFTDSPSDPSAGKNWKKGIKGSLRTFTVYGKGEQTTSAAASVSKGGAASPAKSAPPAAIAAVGGSASSLGSSAAARPGIGARLSGSSGAASDSVRNVR